MESTGAVSWIMRSLIQYIYIYIYIYIYKFSLAYKNFKPKEIEIRRIERIEKERIKDIVREELTN